MDLHQGNKATDDGLGFPVLTDVVKQFFHRFAQQTNNNGGSSIQVTDKFDTNLQDLNDDCLLEIFSLKFLHPMDLCSLAETCPRFKEITQRVFPKEISLSGDGCLKLKDRGYNFEVTNSDKCKERVFENFGSCLSAVSASYKNVQILSLVAMYCGDNLKSLKLGALCSTIPEELIVQLKPILKQLETLHIHRYTCKVDDKNLFADCDSLIELDVHYCGDAISEKTYPKLERFVFLHDSYSFLSSFFSRHNALKTVYIRSRPRHSFDATVEWDLGMDHNHILQTISRNCQELEELKIPFYVVWDLTDLQNLGQLKKLGIVSNPRGGTICIKWIHQLQSLKSLETLELDVEVDDFSVLISALAQLKKLRELYLYSYSSDPTFTNQFASLSQLKILRICYLTGGIDEILHLISLAVNLEKLQLDWMRYKLTNEDFSKIVNLVKGRSKVLTLKCDRDFSYDSENCDENRKVKHVPWA